MILVCLAVDVAIVGPHRLMHAIALDGTMQITPVLLSLSWLLPMNVLMLVFNLIPAFPLDGGRIARAIVWQLTGDKRRGTASAAKIGQGLSRCCWPGVGVCGCWRRRHASPACGWWRWRSCCRAVALARRCASRRVAERIEGVRVADIMDRQPIAIPSETPVSQALDEFFLRYRWPWFPVVDDGRAGSWASRPGAGPGVDRRRRGLADGRLGARVPTTPRAGASGQDRPLTDC